jgi:hypothetical protein
LDRGVLKRPPSESNIIAGAAVALEKAIITDKMSAGIAQKLRQYVDQTSANSSSSNIKLDTGLGIRERMNAYREAIEKSNASPKPASIGDSLKERMQAYQNATKGSPIEKTPIDIFAPEPTTESPTAVTETKSEDSPTAGSLKDRLSAYQDAVNSKSPPKSPTVLGLNLKDRMNAYQEAATTIHIKKSVEAITSESEKTDDDY